MAMKTTFSDGKSVTYCSCGRMLQLVPEKCVCENSQDTNVDSKTPTNISSIKFPDIYDVLNEMDFDSFEHHASEFEEMVVQALKIYEQKLHT